MENQNTCKQAELVLLGQHLQKEMPNAVYVGSSDYDLTKNEEVTKMFKEDTA